MVRERAIAESHHSQALRQRIDVLARREGGDGKQRQFCPVKISCPKPRNGKLDVSQHSQLEAVMLTVRGPDPAPRHDARREEEDPAKTGTTTGQVAMAADALAAALSADRPTESITPGRASTPTFRVSENRATKP